MNMFPSHILFNGQRTEIKTLLKQNSKSSWEQEFFEFLNEWYNDKDAIKVQTSGSTGVPKRIELKKSFVAESAARTIHFFDLKQGNRILHCLPSRYIAGKLMLVRALVGELDLHLVDPSSDFSFLQTQQFKFAAMVVNQVEKLFQLGNEWNLEHLLIGGSAVPQPLENKLQQVNTLCYSSYAMTETATHIALRQINSTKHDDYYHCLEGISVDLNEQSCIRIKMPGLESGSIETNDLGELKNVKTFKVLGRADNVIISGGIKFLPEQIEKKLENSISLPFAISSVPDNLLGEKLILIIEGSSSELLRTKIETNYQRLLSKYEQPKAIVYTDKLPRTENGKIDRKELKRFV